MKPEHAWRLVDAVLVMMFAFVVATVMALAE